MTGWQSHDHVTGMCGPFTHDREINIRRTVHQAVAG
jgi:hypothetical protein